MAELTTLDPVFEGLLREVASDPDSRLLRAPRSRDVPRWLSLGAPASANDMELGRAERELVRVGREELAWLFRQAALREYVDGERTRGEVIRGREVDERHRPLERKQVAESITAAGNGLAEEHDAHALLERWLLASPHARPTAACLAAASMRFAPSRHARAIAGSDYLIRGEFSSAEEWLTASLAGEDASERAVPRWNNLALVMIRQGRIDHALSATRKALALAPEDLVARSGLLICATLQSNITHLRKAARALDAVERENRESIDAYIATIRAQRRRGLLALPPLAAQLAKKNAGDFQAAGRILHELE